MTGRPGRYQDILDSFTRHVAERGYDGAGFGLVADELGLSPGTIVHHFGSKGRLLAAMHESFMRHRLAELDLLLERIPDRQTELRLAAVLHAFMLYPVLDRAPTVAFQREIVRLADQEEMAEGRALRARYERRVREVLQTGVDRGAYRPVDAGLVTLLTFGAAQWAWTWFHPDGRATGAQVGSTLVDLVLGSLLVDRSGLPTLAAPAGPAAEHAHRAIADVTERTTTI